MSRPDQCNLVATFNRAYDEPGHGVDRLEREDLSELSRVLARMWRATINRYKELAGSTRRLPD